MKFSYDNIVFRFLNKFVDCLFASFLWLICCIPVVTFGVSTSALYYTVHKSIRGDREYVSKSFFKALKGNFKQATLSWLVVLVIELVLVLDAYVMWPVMKSGGKMGALFYFFIIMAVLVIGWCCMLFPYIARFSNTVKGTLKTSVLLAIRHLPWTFLLLVIFLATCVLIWLIWALVFILPALSSILFDVILERIFRRYMSEEDLARELENEQLDRMTGGR